MQRFTLRASSRPYDANTGGRKKNSFPLSRRLRISTETGSYCEFCRRADERRVATTKRGSSRTVRAPTDVDCGRLGMRSMQMRLLFQFSDRKSLHRIRWISLLCCGRFAATRGAAFLQYCVDA